jgi:carbon storage regulator
MLVLSRKQGQSIVVADNIVVNVVEIGRGRVQIGISAPAHMTIHREEIHQRIQNERTAACASCILPSSQSPVSQYIAVP